MYARKVLFKMFYSIYFDYKSPSIIINSTTLFQLRLLLGEKKKEFSPEETAKTTTTLTVRYLWDDLGFISFENVFFTSFTKLCEVAVMSALFLYLLILVPGERASKMLK